MRMEKNLIAHSPNYSAISSMNNQSSNNQSNLLTIPSILDKNKQKWIDYITNNSCCDEHQRKEIIIGCNSVLKIIQSMESQTDIQVSNDKSFQYDRIRNSFDIRNKDPSTLTIYQREQLKRYQQALTTTTTAIKESN